MPWLSVWCALAQTTSPYAINGRGWTVLVISVSTVLSLVGYCLYRVLTLPPVEMEDLHGPLDIDTRDRQDAD
jgi:hypothetical protein